MRYGNERRKVLPLSALSTVEVRAWRGAYDVVVTVEGTLPRTPCGVRGT